MCLGLFLFVDDFDYRFGTCFSGLLWVLFVCYFSGILICSTLLILVEMCVYCYLIVFIYV